MSPDPRELRPKLLVGKRPSSRSPQSNFFRDRSQYGLTASAVHRAAHDRKNSGHRQRVQSFVISTEVERRHGSDCDDQKSSRYQLIQLDDSKLQYWLRHLYFDAQIIIEWPAMHH